jgi:hypothetical protein
MLLLPLATLLVIPQATVGDCFAILQITFQGFRIWPMDEDSELSASVVRNLDVVVAAYNHLDRIERRFLEVTMVYLQEVADGLNWYLGGMDENSELHGFNDHWFCPNAWVNQDKPDETDVYFNISSNEPEDADLHWITCFTAALGDEACTELKFEWPKLPKRNGNRNFLAREDITRDISALGFEIDGTKVMCRVAIDREILAKAFDEDDGEDISDGFRAALAPLGDLVGRLAKKIDAWNALRIKILTVADE